MVSNEYIVRNKDPPKNIKTEFCLEKILKEKPSLDTDIMDFLAIAGWNYWRSPIYEKGDENLRKKIKENCLKTKAGLSKSKKIRRGIFVNAVGVPYSMKEIKMIRDLKETIEQRGLVYRHLGYNSLAEFNKTLKKYKIEPFKVGGKHTYAKTLKKYGLELAEK